jgi:hypothetical protein
VLEQFARVQAGGEPWLEIESRVIDRYEAQRARDTLEWAALCAERNREKAEAVARVKQELVLSEDKKSV